MTTLTELLKHDSPKVLHSKLNVKYNEVLQKKDNEVLNAITKHEKKAIIKKYSIQLKEIELLYVELNKKFCNLY